MPKAYADINHKNLDGFELNSTNISQKTLSSLKRKSKETNFKYRTLNLGSVKMFFTIENDELVYKFI